MQTFCWPLTCKSLCMVVYSDLLYHHYKIQTTKKCQTMILLQEVNWVICYLSERTSRCYSYLIKSHKAHFELSGCVSNTLCYWNTANPYELHLKPLRYQTVTIWCRILVVSITGPYFFKDEIGSAITMTSDWYVHMVKDFLFPQLCHDNIDFTTIWSQHAIATEHNTQQVIHILWNMFKPWIISHYDDIY